MMCGGLCVCARVCVCVCVCKFEFADKYMQLYKNTQNVERERGKYCHWHCSYHSLPVTNLAPSSSMTFNHSLWGSVPTTTVQPAVSMAPGRGLWGIPITHSSPKWAPVSCSLLVSLSFLCSSAPHLAVLPSKVLVCEGW